MPRNRVLYGAEGLFVGPTPSTGSHFSAGQAGAPGTITLQYNSGTCLVTGLTRVQDINYGWTINRQNVNEFGQLDAIDRVILDSPTVNLDFRYIVNSLYNEKLLGFSISTGTNITSAISGMLNKVSDDKNYFIRTFREGDDAIANSSRASNVYTIGIGNGFINNYSVQGAVGSFPIASIGVEALNFKIDEVSGYLPAVNPIDGSSNTALRYDLPNYTKDPASAGLTNSALRPGDITVSLGAYGTDATEKEPGPVISDLKIQSFNIGVNLSRTPLLKLGNKYAFSREINFPTTATASFTANVGDIRSGNLASGIVTDASYNLEVNLNAVGTTNAVVKYMLYNAKIDSQSFSSSIGPAKTVTLNFSSQIGGPNSTGIAISGWN